MDPLVNADFTTKRKTSSSFLSKLVSPNDSDRKNINNQNPLYKNIFNIGCAVPDIHNNIINNNNDNVNDNNNIITNIKHHRL